jgi:solute carrier family 35 protein E1
LWYGSSALTNTSSKAILTAFDKPATLTLVQFGFVSSYCILFSWLASTFPRLRAAVPALRHPIRYPSRDVIRTTLPLAAFQIGGHLLSSNATSKIPVSLVHTIKGLSPLFTVLAYRFFFNIRYPRATYFSLIPLTIGVMLACSGKHGFGGHFLGILYALLAAIIFVTQNIFSKRLFNEAAIAEKEGHIGQSRKLDKLNLLCYSSGLAFILTWPIWFWSEGIGILGDFLYDGSVDLNQGPKSLDHGPLLLEYIFNGTFHFGQNILAFILLSMVSPVTYSVASLIKRVFVIVIAIIWFRSPTTTVQAVGIGLTFFGLYLYDRSNERNKADQRARSLSTSTPNASLLPLNTKHALPNSGNVGAMNGGAGGILAGQNGSARLYESPVSVSPGASVAAFGSSRGVGTPPHIDSKKSDDVGGNTGGGRIRGTSNAGWRPPGTRQEETWRPGDAQMAAVRS